MEKQKFSDHITRREALRRGVVGAAGLALTGSLSRPARSAALRPKETCAPWIERIEECLELSPLPCKFRGG